MSHPNDTTVPLCPVQTFTYGLPPGVSPATVRPISTREIWQAPLAERIVLLEGLLRRCLDALPADSPLRGEIQTELTR